MVCLFHLPKKEKSQVKQMHELTPVVCVVSVHLRKVFVAEQEGIHTMAQLEGKDCITRNSR